MKENNPISEEQNDAMNSSHAYSETKPISSISNPDENSPVTMEDNYEDELYSDIDVDSTIFTSENNNSTEIQSSEDCSEINVNANENHITNDIQLTEETADEVFDSETEHESDAEPYTMVENSNKENRNLETKCNCEEYHQEVKEQTSLLKKISQQISSLYNRFKRAWLTVTALGVLISAVQLWRDYNAPSFTEEMQHIIESNKLAEQYKLPDSLSTYHEVRDLYSIQVDLETTYYLMTFYPQKIQNLLLNNKIKSKDDAMAYITSAQELHDYKLKINNLFINCIGKGKILYEKLHLKSASNAELAFSESSLNKMLNSITEYNKCDSTINTYYAGLYEELNAKNTSDSKYPSIVSKYSSKLNKIYGDEFYKGYYSAMLSFLRTINMMVNIRLHEIELEVIEDRYDETDVDLNVLLELRQLLDSMNIQ